jgi:hypothetical protein
MTKNRRIFDRAVVMSSIMPSAKTSTLVGIAAAPLLNYVSFPEGSPSSLRTLRWREMDSNFRFRMRSQRRQRDPIVPPGRR